jgi:hypothetical protein
LKVLSSTLNSLGDIQGSKDALTRAYQNVVDYPGFGKDHPLAKEIATLMQQQKEQPKENAIIQQGLFANHRAPEQNLQAAPTANPSKNCCLVL